MVDSPRSVLRIHVGARHREFGPVGAMVGPGVAHEDTALAADPQQPLGTRQHARGLHVGSRPLKYVEQEQGRVCAVGRLSRRQQAVHTAGNGYDPAFPAAGGPRAERP